MPRSALFTRPPGDDPVRLRPALDPGAAAVESGGAVDIIDVAGVPRIGSGQGPPAEDYFALIPLLRSNADLVLGDCGPSPAAHCEQSTARDRQVQKRRATSVYHRGAYGALFDAEHVRLALPVHALEDDGPSPEGFYARPDLRRSRYMTGVMLPADSQRRMDRIGMLGAYVQR